MKQKRYTEPQIVFALRAVSIALCNRFRPIV